MQHTRNSDADPPAFSQLYQKLGVKRYIDISVHRDILCTIRYKYENIDTKRYDFAVKDTRATWRVPRKVVNAKPASFMQNTSHAAEQRSWISVIFTIISKKTL